jgi:tetratricopeptide (TPR) repeat protein
MTTAFHPSPTGIVRNYSAARRLMPVLIPFMLLTLPLLAVSCSDPEPQTLEARVANLMEQNEYEAALELLADADGDPVRIEAFRIQVHLAYANYLTHEADHLAMGARMATALRHYRRVAALDPDNSQAQTHIELIEGIYEQMGREIPEGIAE